VFLKAMTALGSFWFPPQSSTFAGRVDGLFFYIFWTSTIFFVGIMATAAYFVIRYRRRDGVKAGQTSSHNTALELTWSILPGLLLIPMFYFGFTEYMDARTPPAQAYEIQVTAMKWKWLFTYPNGHVDEDLHAPVGVPVRLTMRSEDVIHSLFIPDFRTKMDVVPGRYTTNWFQANEAGTHQIFCAEYCGQQHSSMKASVVIHEPGQFETWLANADKDDPSVPPAKKGEKLFNLRGCTQCHALEAKPGMAGPSFKGDSGSGIFGETHTMTDGTTALVDENYIRESILDPEAKVVRGFKPQMPSFKGKISDKDITNLIEFIKSLKENK
jgi:cytochrome c oxidase subunit 2